MPRVFLNLQPPFIYKSFLLHPLIPPSKKNYDDNNKNKKLAKP